MFRDLNNNSLLVFGVKDDVSGHMRLFPFPFINFGSALRYISSSTGADDIQRTHSDNFSLILLGALEDKRLISMPLDAPIGDFIVVPFSDIFSPDSNSFDYDTFYKISVLDGSLYISDLTDGS